MWPENVAAAEAFLGICTQWRTGSVGMGGLKFIGLDYSAARAGFDMRGLTVSPDLWMRVQVIETAALIALNESATTS